MASARRRRLRITVLMGGRSGEHEVSLVSARAVIAGLDPKKYQVTPILISRSGAWRAGGKALANPWAALRRSDLVLPILHGTYGEDGTVQGLLEMIGVPYAGAGVLGSAAAMDKDVMKRLFLQAGLPTPRYHPLRREKNWPLQALERELGYPMFVKPANLGSSVGISKAHRRSELRPALEFAARYDAKVIVEEGIDARELECAVLGNEAPEASIAGEVIAGKEFYDYEAKYRNAGSRTVIPAPIPAQVMAEVRSLALRAFAACECEGLARVDFFLERGTNRLLVNEVNTMPGFTPISMYPKMWEASGLPFPRLLDRMVALGLERGRARRRLAVDG
ncbi:MAG TPA: D-alanine--D-alanine ligase family protein [Terriglobales bacterium]|nr:D-alanine--D-alanine ligase family protein [Terriglobales bacterium]